MKKIIVSMLVIGLLLTTLPMVTLGEEAGNKHSVLNKYDMVIISKSCHESTVQPLIDHKNEHGVKTYFKDVNEIYKEFSGRDKPEKIKYFIKDAIETKGISYVLIVGHILQVPMRRISFYEFGSSFTAVSDLYYADVYDENGDFCSWDSNDNNLFGEYRLGEKEEGGAENIDEVDLYADVHIGRIPCLFIRDLEIIVNKIITYENGAYGADWFKKVLLLGGDTWGGNDVIEGEFVTNLIGNEMEKHGFETIKLWCSLNNLRPKNVNYQTNKGVGFISYSGHGMPSMITTERFFYFNFNLLGLHNQEKLPIVFFDACLTAKLDHIVSPFAYNIVKKANGGAIAAIGATQISYMGVDKEGLYGGSGYLNLQFFKNYEEGITVGEMFTRAQYEYINTVEEKGRYIGKDTFTLGEFILIGDPSLKVGGYDQSR